MNGFNNVKVFFQNGSWFFIVLLGTLLLALVFSRLFSNYFKKSSEQLHISDNQYGFLKHLLIAAVYISGIGFAIYLIPPLRNISFSIFAGSGIIAVVIGFASQHSIANIISGLFITIFKPFCVGDRIKIIGRELTGIVEDITLRHTVIKTFENKRIIVPNAIISTDVLENSNFVDEKICKFIEVGISYDSDLAKAKKIIEEECLAHSETLDNRNEEQIANNEPIVPVRLISFGESSLNLRANVWLKDPPTAFLVGCELNEKIKYRFDQEGIEIPFPHRTIVQKK